MSLKQTTEIIDGDNAWVLEQNQLLCCMDWADYCQGDVVILQCSLCTHSYTPRGAPKPHQWEIYAILWLQSLVSIEEPERKKCNLPLKINPCNHWFYKHIKHQKINRGAHNAEYSFIVSFFFLSWYIINLFPAPQEVISGHGIISQRISPWFKYHGTTMAQYVSVYWSFYTHSFIYAYSEQIFTLEAMHASSVIFWKETWSLYSWACSIMPLINFLGSTSSPL